MRVVRPAVYDEEANVDGDADNGGQHRGQRRHDQLRGDDQRGDEHERDRRPKEHAADADFKPDPHGHTVPPGTAWWPSVGQGVRSTGARARVGVTTRRRQAACLCPNGRRALRLRITGRSFRTAHARVAGTQARGEERWCTSCGDADPEDVPRRTDPCGFACWATTARSGRRSGPGTGPQARDLHSVQVVQ